MSHSPHGECDNAPQRTDETSGFEQPAGGAKTLDQAASLLGVSERHTRRILAAYREEGAAARAHGHRGRRAPNATPHALAADVVHLARTRYAGVNHTHLSELLSERERIDIGRSTLRRILVNAELSSPRSRRPPSTGCAASACPGRAC